MYSSCVSQVYRATLYQAQSYLNSMKKNPFYSNQSTRHPPKKLNELPLKALLYRPATETFVVVLYCWHNKETKVPSRFSCSFAQLPVNRADKNTAPGSPLAASSDLSSETWSVFGKDTKENAVVISSVSVLHSPSYKADSGMLAACFTQKGE